MNHDAAKSRAARLEEVARLGGQDAYRLHALQRLQPKTVIRESHCSPVHALCFNHTGDGGELGVLFATVGKDQATVYTDAHMEDYVGLVVQLHNQPSEHAAGGELQAACWVSTAGWTPHPHGDAALAVAGADPAISVVSVVEARVVQLLRGHEREVVELAAAPAAPRLLLSLAKGGNVRLWDVPEAACLASVATDATCLALAPDGASFVAGTARGRLYRYDIAAGQGGRDIREESRAELQLQGGGGHTEPIDCVVRRRAGASSRREGGTRGDGVGGGRAPCRCLTHALSPPGPTPPAAAALPAGRPAGLQVCRRPHVCVGPGRQQEPGLLAGARVQRVRGAGGALPVRGHARRAVHLGGARARSGAALRCDAQRALGGCERPCGGAA